MRTALYLRVSTIHQKPDLQADGLRRYAIHAALEIVAEYLDIAVSGRREGRPQLQALMRAAHSHGDAFTCVGVRVALAIDPENIIFPGQLQPLSSVVCGLSQFRASD